MRELGCFSYGSELNEIRLAKNFYLSEFENKEQLVKLHPRLVQGLQRLRDMIRQPIVITSGYRSQEEQMEINPSAPNSYHIRGMAADIYVKDYPMLELWKWAVTIPEFYGVGLYDRHVHVDVRPEGKSWYWIRQQHLRGEANDWKKLLKLLEKE